MVFRKRMVRRRRGGLRKRVMRKRMVKRNTNFVGGPNTAKVTETYNLGNIVSNNPYLFIKAGITPGNRAATTAPNFGLYRIARITFTLRPFYDTYTPNLGQAGGGQIGNQPTAVPYLYWKINRYGDAPAGFGAQYLRDQGSKPIRLDDKIVTWSYRPNILVADALAGAAVSGQVKMTPWLSTDIAPQDAAFALSTTDHYGHLLYVEGAAAGNAQPVIGQLEAKVVYEFKNPRGVNETPGVDASGNPINASTVIHV